MRTYLFMALCVFSLGAYAQNNKDIGVILLAHGGSMEWNQMVANAAIPVSEMYPTEIAFGMANPYTMQTAITNLEEKGIRKIVVVQLFISSYSFIPRQNEYLLGLRETMTQPPIVMKHGSHSENHNTGHRSMDDPWANPASSFPKLKHKSEIILSEPLNDHHLVAEILLDHANELSKNKDNEVLILVGHGPVSESDNTEWVGKMESLSKQIRNLSGGEDSFKMIFSVTVRDDADEEIYNQAKENLRLLVRQSSYNNNVIVVPLLLSKGGIEEGIVERLEGLNYVWSGKTLLPNAKISEFITTSVSEALNKY